MTSRIELAQTTTANALHFDLRLSRWALIAEFGESVGGSSRGKHRRSEPGRSMATPHENAERQRKPMLKERVGLTSKPILPEAPRGAGLGIIAASNSELSERWINIEGNASTVSVGARASAERVRR